jgi:hypothetical protein
MNAKKLVRRNEAICCLIGFSIGIGCCLMYRWIRNTFFSLQFRKSYDKLTSTTAAASSSLVKLNNKIAGATSTLLSRSSHYCNDANGILFDTSWHNSDCNSYFKKPSLFANKRAKRPKKEFWSRSSSKQQSFDYYSGSSGANSKVSTLFS